MAIIQIKRRTSSGTGPLVGTTGSVKAGEPLVDFSGEHLYIAKKDKTASSSTPLVAGDYLAFPSTGEVDKKIKALGLKDGSKYEVGYTEGKIPLVSYNGKLPASILPEMSLVKSVNGKTGAVTVTLGELGGLAASTFNSHKGDSTHITDDQKTKISGIKSYELTPTTALTRHGDLSSLRNSSIIGGLNFFTDVDTSYNPARVRFYLGIDKDKVFGSTSVIDGGTY